MPAASTVTSSRAPRTGEPTFASLGVDADLATDLATRGFSAPFPIQTATLPDTLAGRDVLGRGRTGSGKTLAFALPLVQRLAAQDKARPGHPLGLVLAVFYSPWCWLFLAPLVLVTAGPAALIADRANSPLLFLRLTILYFLYGLARSVDLVGLSPRKKSWKS